MLFYRVLCAKNNIDFVSRLLVARVKLILGAPTRLMFVVLNIFYMRPWFLFKGLLFHTNGTILPN